MASFLCRPNWLYWISSLVSVLLGPSGKEESPVRQEPWPGFAGLQVIRIHWLFPMGWMVAGESEGLRLLRATAT
jgi:hypothetical protein